jgi:hypothetical protein
VDSTDEETSDDPEKGEGEDADAEAELEDTEGTNNSERPAAASVAM